MNVNFRIKNGKFIDTIFLNLQDYTIRFSGALSHVMFYDVFFIEFISVYNPDKNFVYNVGDFVSHEELQGLINIILSLYPSVSEFKQYPDLNTDKSDLN